MFRSRPRPAVRLQVEALESRTLMTRYAFTPIASTWGHGTNAIAINNEGLVAFALPVADTLSIGVGDGSTTTTLGATDDPHFLSLKFHVANMTPANSGFPAWAFSDDGTAYFTRYTSLPAPDIYSLAPGASIPSVFQKTSTTFQWVAGASVSESGVVAFVGGLIASNGDAGYYEADGKDVRSVVVSGGTSPYIFDGATFGIAINNLGQVSFLAKLSGSPVFYAGLYAYEKRGVFTGPDPTRDKVLMNGDSLFGSVVVGLGVIGGWWLNDAGQMAFKVALADGRVFVVRADPLPDLPPEMTVAAASPDLIDPASAAAGLQNRDSTDPFFVALQSGANAPAVQTFFTDPRTTMSIAVVAPLELTSLVGGGGETPADAGADLMPAAPMPANAEDVEEALPPPADAGGALALPRVEHPLAGRSHPVEAYRPLDAAFVQGSLPSQHLAQDRLEVPPTDSSSADASLAWSLLLAVGLAEEVRQRRSKPRL